MTFGPGKYDDMCTSVRLKTDAKGVILIVFGGNRGPGFSQQWVLEDPLETVDTLMNAAANLRKVADQMQADARRLRQSTRDVVPHTDAIPDAHTLHDDPELKHGDFGDTPKYCPVCEHRFDAYAGGNTSEIVPGACMVCSRCGRLLYFTETLDLRVATEKEMATMPQEVIELIYKVMNDRKY